MITKSKNLITASSGWTITRSDTLSDSEKREDARIAAAVVAKVIQMQKHGIPIARYNAKTGEVFLEMSDNTAGANS